MIVTEHSSIGNTNRDSAYTANVLFVGVVQSIIEHVRLRANIDDILLIELIEQVIYQYSNSRC